MLEKHLLWKASLIEKNNMELNVLTLAYLGDAIYEFYIRDFLISKNIIKVNDLQKKAVEYVSAKAQARILKSMIEEDFFTEEELNIIYRARNHKSRSSRSTDIVTYKHSTAFEAVIGYLYYKNNQKRIEEIMEYVKGEN